MITEDEARTKWCPFARDVAFYDNGANMGSASYNRPFGKDFSADQTCTCIASDCMAWEWESPGGDMGRQHTNPGAERHGDCGLKRRPHD